MPMTPSGTATRSMASPFGRVHAASTRPTGSGKLGDRLEPGGDRLDPLRVEREAVAQAGGEALALGLGEVAGIGGEDLGRSGPHRPRGIVQRRDLCLGGGEGEGGGGLAGAPADLGHRRRQIRSDVAVRSRSKVSVVIGRSVTTRSSR